MGALRRSLLGLVAVAFAAGVSSPSAFAGQWQSQVPHPEFGTPDNKRPSPRADAAGDVWLTFARQGGGGMVTYRPAGGVWATPQQIAPTSNGLVLAVDRFGNGIIAWQAGGRNFASVHLAATPGMTWQPAQPL